MLRKPNSPSTAGNIDDLVFSFLVIYFLVLFVNPLEGQEESSFISVSLVLFAGSLTNLY